VNIIMSLDGLKAGYLWWLKSAYSYYWQDGEPMEGCEIMSDSLWSALGGLYYKNIDHFPFLSKVEFTGTSLGAHCTQEILLGEIEDEQHIRSMSAQ
jgi:hypothetical protein